MDLPLPQSTISYMFPKIPANVFLRFFIVSSGSSRSLTIASTLLGDAGPSPAPDSLFCGEDCGAGAGPPVRPRLK